MGFYNPFHKIYYRESQKHIHAKTLRSSIWGKLANTFTVIAGSLLDEKEEKKHVGLFDWFTFFIPWAILKFADWSVEVHVNKKFTLLWIPATFLSPLFVNLAFFLHIIRWLSAAIITLIVSPFVLTVHLLANLFTEPLRKILGEIPVTLNPDHMYYGICADKALKENPTLDAVLNSYHLVLDDLDSVVGAQRSDLVDKKEIQVNLCARGEHLGSVTLKKSELPYYSLQFFNVGLISYKTEKETLSCMEFIK